jgi:uncharacterized protein YcbX
MDGASVVALQRFPLKSTTGEGLSRLELDRRGVIGDRLWSVRTAAGKIGSGKDTRRFAAVPGLLELRSAYDEAGDAVVTFPDGSTLALEDATAAERISAFLGQPVTLARETDVTHFDDGPVSLIGQASIAALAAERGVDIDPARFRANVLLATTAAFEEDAWVGRQVRIGGVVLQVELPSPRCVMINMETADLPAQPGNLAVLGRLHDAQLGVVASVVEPGALCLGDVVRTGGH